MQPTLTSAPTWPTVRSLNRCKGRSRPGRGATGRSPDYWPIRPWPRRDHPEALPADLAGLYAESLLRTGAGVSTRWRDEFRPVLGVLAAAGVGPILPLPLLCAASARLGGPARPFRVRDVLVDLRGLVVRTRPGTDDEHVGLFHQTLADYLLDPTSDPFGIDPQEPHRALAEAIAELAPASAHDANDPLHRYAAAREAVHRWALGEYGRVVECLSLRESVIPAENLRQWRSWGTQMEAVLGRDHPDTLATRSNIAGWTGEAGDAAGALRLLRELLPDMERVLGRDHPDTLATRSNIAGWTGEAGDAAGALRLLRELLPDMERVLGRDHPETLSTRRDIARWAGEAGDVPRPCGCCASCSRTWSAPTARSPHHACDPQQPGPLDRRGGGRIRGMRLLPSCCPTRSAVLGRDHPDTLRTRSNIARWTGEAGDVSGACGCCASCCPTRSACWVGTTPTHSGRGATSPVGRARRGTYPGRCGCCASCCPTRSACWVGTTPTHSGRARLFKQLREERFPTVQSRRLRLSSYMALATSNLRPTCWRAAGCRR